MVALTSNVCAHPCDGILPQEMTNLDAPVDSEVEAADEAISENHMLLAQHNSALLLLT